MATKSDSGGGFCGLILLGAILYGGYTLLKKANWTGGREAYASDYSCWYLKDKAQYDVFYWRNVEEDNEDDNRLIASVRGLPACRGKAIEYAASIGEQWNDRAYICVLLKDDSYKEKHRLLPD